MRTQTPLRIVFAIALLPILLASCSQNPFGIFESIENERLIIDDRNLGNGINLAAFTKIGTKYYAAAGALYRRDVTDPNYVAGERAQWSTVAAPGTNYTTDSVVSVDFGAGERLFAIFTDSGAGSASAAGVVYEITGPTGDTPATQARFPLADDTGVAEAYEVFAVTDGSGTWLAVSARLDDGNYAVYATDDGTTFAEVAGTKRGGAPYIDATDNATSVAFLTAGGVVVDEDGINTGAGADLKAAVALSSGDYLTGLIHDGSAGGSGLLWAADDGGHIYTSALDIASAWQKSETRVVGSSTDLPFLDFALVPVDGSTTHLWVGTRGYGYRVIGDTSTITYETAPSLPGSDDSNYQAADLAGSVVQTIFVDTVQRSDYPVPTPAGNPYELIDGYLVFAGTTDQGLWRALSYPGAIQWVRE